MQIESTIDTTLYRNRWIAIVRNRVIGVGLTREQAYRAAKRVRPKDTPQLLFITIEGQPKQKADELSPLTIEQALASHPLLQQTIDILQKLQLEVYLVGGPVRDLLLERGEIVDFDFAVPQDGLKVARRVADALGAAFYPLDPERGTGRVVQTLEPTSKPFYLDFATFRGSTLEADLADRDFTINAMAVNLTGSPQLIDPLDGQRSLDERLIRAVSPKAFLNDPVRVLRAIRQAVEFNFTIESHTESYLSEAAPHLNRVSPERQRDELLKLLNVPMPGQALKLLHQYWVLHHILPEVEATVGVEQTSPHYLDVFEHTVAALNSWAKIVQMKWIDFPDDFRANLKQQINQPLAGNTNQRALLPVALLLHDVGKPATQTYDIVDNHPKIRFLGHEQDSAKIARRVLHRLRFSRQATDFVVTIIKNHMRPLQLSTEKKLSRRAIHRFFRDTGGTAFEAGVATVLHALADHRATYPPEQGQAEETALLSVAHQLFTAFFERRDEVVDPPPLLTGRDLIEMGVPQGKLIGLLLNRLIEAQVTGQVIDKTSALAFIRNDPDFANYQKREL